MSILCTVDQSMLCTLDQSILCTVDQSILCTVDQSILCTVDQSILCTVDYSQFDFQPDRSVVPSRHASSYGGPAFILCRLCLNLIGTARLHTIVCLENIWSTNSLFCNKRKCNNQNYNQNQLVWGENICWYGEKTFRSFLLKQTLMFH